MKRGVVGLLAVSGFVVVLVSWVFSGEVPIYILSTSNPQVTCESNICTILFDAQISIIYTNFSINESGINHYNSIYEEHIIKSGKIYIGNAYKIKPLNYTLQFYSIYADFGNETLVGNYNANEAIIENNTFINGQELNQAGILSLYNEAGDEWTFTTTSYQVAVNDTLNPVAVEIFGDGGRVVYSQDNRISLLESWQQSVNNTLQTIQTTLASILTTLTGHTSRLTNLENQQPLIQNGTIPNYFKYLSSSDRKNIVCGYGKDSHLTNVTDLGLNCLITYRNTSRGESASCRCKQV